MLSLCQVGGICSVSWSFGCSVGPGFGVGLAQLGNVNGVQVPRGCLFRPFLGLTYRFLKETELYVLNGRHSDDYVLKKVSLAGYI